MSLRNYSNLINLCYQYIGYKNDNKDEYIEKSVIKALKELEEISAFKYIYVEYSNIIDVLDKEPYLSFLSGADSYYIVATTLGVMVDKRISLLSKIDMPYMVIFNSCAAAYLEYLADNYEYNNLGDDLSYRFCPGYGGSSVSDLTILKKFIRLDKIGIQVFESGMMLPEKSMFGIVAKNNNKKKSCMGCVLQKKCKYLKEGRKCYN